MAGGNRIPVLSSTTFQQFEAATREGNFIPVYRELRFDTGSPVSAFLRFKNAKNAFLLESVEGGERWGRYSFLSAQPRMVLRFEQDRCTLQEGSSRKVITGQPPLSVMRAILGERRFARTPNLPPFCGGLVGYLSWSCVRWFEPRVPQRLGPDPDFPDAEWMLVDQLIAFDALRHSVKLIACADLQKHRTARAAWQEAQQELDGLQQALERPVPRTGGAPARPTRITEAWSADAFKAAVERVREYIKAGDCMQVVLSRRLSARYDGDPFELYRSVRSASPAPYLFHLRFGERSLSAASPEVLVRVSDRNVTIRPIAGTRRRGATPEEDLALEAELKRDPKEVAEHVMLLDLGRNDVGRVAAPGAVRVEEREVIERYSHVMHLVSQVSGRLHDDLDALDAVAAAFPAGTVSGAPKVRAMEIIDELEPVPRGPYAGAVGYLGFDGSADLAINIRGVALCGDRLRFQAGAGLVHDSSPARELEETAEKMRGMLVALGGAEPGRATRRSGR